MVVIKSRFATAVSSCLYEDEIGAANLISADFVNSLASHGFATELCAVEEQDLADRVRRVAETLGTVTRGRRDEVEALTPLHPAEAHPASLSAVFGKGRLPWHMDTAHRPEPVRFLVFGCAECSNDEASIYLTEWRSAVDSIFPTDLLQSALFLVKNGRSSFYSEPLGRSGEYLRHDPGCMTPLNDEASWLQQVLSTWSPKAIFEIQWKRGTVLAIDNWRLLHRRGDANSSNSRRLLRCYANERK